MLRVKFDASLLPLRHVRAPSVRIQAAGQRSRQQQRRTSGNNDGSKPSSINSAMPGLARSASKRVNRFSKQRMQRMLQRQGGPQDQTHSGDSDLEDALPDGIHPFTPVVVDHMKGKSATNEESGSSGRGRGAKRGAARALLESYVSVFGLALDLELEEEWEEAEQRLQVIYLVSVTLVISGLARAVWLLLHLWNAWGDIVLWST